MPLRLVAKTEKGTAPAFQEWLRCSISEATGATQGTGSELVIELAHQLLLSMFECPPRLVMDLQRSKSLMLDGYDHDETAPTLHVDLGSDSLSSQDSHGRWLCSTSIAWDSSLLIDITAITLLDIVYIYLAIRDLQPGAAAYIILESW
jgi:hypothetical protein